MIDMQHIGKRAKAAAQRLAWVTTEEKNAALRAMADALEAHADDLRAANALDLEDGRAAGLSDALLDRMSLAGGRIAAIAADMRQVANLPDPVGAHFDIRTLPNGLRVRRQRTPIGVIGVIYEARPNVTADVIALTLKTANAVILRGGKEIMRSTRAMLDVLRGALAAFPAIPADALQAIDDPDRAYITELLRLDQYVDMIIPRGGAALHRLCRDNATIPVITGGIGVCHAFIDATAQLDHALEIVFNGKTQRPSVCNALDTVLVHEAVAADFLPRMAARLAAAGVVFKADPTALPLLAGVPGVSVTEAGEGDFDTEWMALILGVRVVRDLDEALAHITAHSTGHSEAIITGTPEHAERFTTGVDASAVFVNASTRFNDGGQLGLGAEIAVSTQKLHARGPMALEELTTYKWVVIGDGHVRA
jgi:glutamate-5-semialdehyde dehydrogenase